MTAKFLQWITQHKRTLVFAALTVLISTTSFAAGYLLARDANVTPIIIQQ